MLQLPVGRTPSRAGSPAASPHQIRPRPIFSPARLRNASDRPASCALMRGRQARSCQSTVTTRTGRREEVVARINRSGQRVVDLHLLAPVADEVGFPGNLQLNVQII